MKKINIKIIAFDKNRICGIPIINLDVDIKELKKSLKKSGVNHEKMNLVILRETSPMNYEELWSEEQ